MGVDGELRFALTDGENDDFVVGIDVGMWLGLKERRVDGLSVGFDDGLKLGITDGANDGLIVGIIVGK
jgi:hypothetical protein